jgi:Na+/proline symporter
VVALVFVQNAVDGGAPQVLRESYAAGKLRVLNLNLNTKEAYTLWCGLFATGWLTLASHGTDQMMAQRMFTCRGPAEARKAIIWSSAGVLLTALLLFVGAGLFVYYRHHPLSAAGEAAVEAQSMRIFAIFIVEVLPAGVSGLLMAGIFATAISTLDSTLAALSQSTIATIYLPWKRRRAGLSDDSTAEDPVSDRHLLVASRVLVIFWGILMTAFAIFCDVLQRRFEDLIQFALAMAAYTYGALLGTFLLAFLPFRRDDRGLVYGVPLSMLTVFALNWHAPVAKAVVILVSLVLVIHAIRNLRSEPAKILLVTTVAAAVIIIGVVAIGSDTTGNPTYISIAWPWHYPIGTAVTLGVGWAVGRRKG